MKLPHNFEEQANAGGTDYNAPPYKIRGRDLDENFKRVKPKDTVGDDSVAYKISEDAEQGWQMIFPWWPPPEKGHSVLISINKKMQWMSPAPTDGTYVVGAVNGEIKWIATEACEEEA
jgi:hypothetical protein